MTAFLNLHSRDGCLILLPLHSISVVLQEEHGTAVYLTSDLSGFSSLIVKESVGEIARAIQSFKKD